MLFIIIAKIFSGFYAGIYFTKVFIDYNTLKRMKHSASNISASKGISKKDTNKIIKSITVYKEVRTSLIYNAFIAILLITISFLLK